jgi:DnaJ domain
MCKEQILETRRSIRPTFFTLWLYFRCRDSACFPSWNYSTWLPTRILRENSRAPHVIHDGIELCSNQRDVLTDSRGAMTMRTSVSSLREKGVNRLNDDYYAWLGVPVDASLTEIKSAYRSLVKRYHPDVYAFDDAAAQRKAVLAMRQINKAYAVLSQSGEQQRYDERFQASKASRKDQLTNDDRKGSEKEVKIGSYSGLLAVFAQRFSDQRTVVQEKPMMGVFRKTLLAPIPFCVATASCSVFWNIGQLTHATILGGLTAVLCYPLILISLFSRLFGPIRHLPLLSFKQKLVAVPAVLTAAMCTGWLWVEVADRFGSSSNRWDFCWWCGLIGLTCAILASL